MPKTTEYHSSYVATFRKSALCYLFEERCGPLQVDEEEEKTEDHEIDDDGLLERRKVLAEATHRCAGDRVDDESHQPGKGDDPAKRVICVLDHLEELQLAGAVVGEKVGMLKLLFIHLSKG